MKTHILCSVTFFRKLHCLWDNVEKYGGDRGATNDVTIWRIRFACWISKATCTYAHAHTDQYVILTAFEQQQWLANAPQCYVIRTLPVLLYFSLSDIVSLFVEMQINTLTVFTLPVVAVYFWMYVVRCQVTNHRDFVEPYTGIFF
jgi:hypothetical protein